MGENFKKVLEVLEDFYPGKVTDLTAPKTEHNRSNSIRYCRIVFSLPSVVRRSHRLTDVPLEIEEESEAEESEFFISLTIMLMSILRIIWILISLPHTYSSLYLLLLTSVTVERYHM